VTPIAPERSYFSDSHTPRLEEGFVIGGRVRGAGQTIIVVRGRTVVATPDDARSSFVYDGPDILRQDYEMKGRRRILF
jgi:hypothetical protein